MTKRQLAQWIVDKFKNEESYPVICPCPICSQMPLVDFRNESANCDGKCVENIRQALIDAEKERYGNGRNNIKL